MKKNNFCVFILSHGRPENVVTLKTLKKCGYTGDWYVVVDDEDEKQEEYETLYQGNVIKFCKEEQAKKFDQMDASEDRRSVVYARNACFEIAKELGYKYFLELDDDYTSLEWRWAEGDKLLVKSVKNADALFQYMIDFLEVSGAKTVALAQGGDFIGGANGGRCKSGIVRKAMNTFFCKTDRKFDFIGRINEDVNTYVHYGSIGELFFTITAASIVQKRTQSNDGGMTGLYLDSGTYLKSFYTVMIAPSCVKVGIMGDKHKRIHHSINWERAVPKILNERWRKKA